MVTINVCPTVSWFRRFSFLKSSQQPNFLIAIPSKAHRRLVFVTLQLYTIFCTFGNVHAIKYFLEAVKNFWVELYEFGKAVSIAIACTRFAPNQINIPNLIMMKCAKRFTILHFNQLLNRTLCIAPELVIHKAEIAFSYGGYLVCIGFDRTILSSVSISCRSSSCWFSASTFFTALSSILSLFTLFASSAKFCG